MRLKGFPESHQDLLEDSKRAFAFLGTIMADGSPQVTPMWFNTDGEHILINTARGRVKDRNMRLRSAVALAIVDPQNPYRYVQVRGNVIHFTEEGADEHINALCAKYTGQKVFPWKKPGEVRVRYIIQPKAFSPKD
jgi:PPOX class probable F420-dependent enzyme